MEGQYVVNYVFTVIGSKVTTTGGQEFFDTLFEVDDFISEFSPANGLQVAGSVFRNGKLQFLFDKKNE